MQLRFFQDPWYLMAAFVLTFSTAQVTGCASSRPEQEDSAAADRARTGIVTDADCIKGPDYHFDESAAGNRCYNDCECDGRSTCSGWNYCTGVAR